MSYQYYLLRDLNESFKNLLYAKNISDLDIEDIYSDTNLSKVEKADNYVYLALQLPEYSSQDNQMEKKQIQIIFNNNYLLVVDDKKLTHFDSFENQRQLGNISFETTYSHALEVIDFLITRSLPLTDKLRLEVLDIEKSVFNFELTKDLVIEITILKKNLINLQSMIKSIKSTLVEVKTKVITDPQHQLQIEDTQDKVDKIISSIDLLKEEISFLTETNEILIARSTNETIKTLTITNLIFLIPTFITSFFGMNVNFGWNVDQFNPIVITFIIAIIVNFTILALYFFKSKKWL